MSRKSHKFYENIAQLSLIVQINSKLPVDQDVVGYVITKLENKTA